MHPPSSSGTRLTPRTALFCAFLALGVLAGAISLAVGQSQNFHVFPTAARDVLSRNDLYAKHAEDYFKYSPTFAFLFVPFILVPAWLGAPLWSLANFLAAFFGIDRVVEDRRE